MKNRVVTPQKIKNRITLWSSSPTSMYMSKILECRISKRYLDIHCIAHLARKQKQSNIPRDPGLEPNQRTGTGAQQEQLLRPVPTGCLLHPTTHLERSVHHVLATLCGLQVCEGADGRQTGTDFVGLSTSAEKVVTFCS